MHAGIFPFASSGQIPQRSRTQDRVSLKKRGHGKTVISDSKIKKTLTLEKKREKKKEKNNEKRKKNCSGD